MFSTQVCTQNPLDSPTLNPQGGRQLQVRSHIFQSLPTRTTTQSDRCTHRLSSLVKRPLYMYDLWSLVSQPVIARHTLIMGCPVRVSIRGGRALAGCSLLVKMSYHY